MALVSKNFGDIITFTRASTATYFDSAGVLQSAAIDVPRFDYDPATLAARGFLIEEARTNSIRNNTMQGAVAGTPGTLPTNWAVSGAGTLVQEIVGTGTDAGINYIDFRLSGTTSTTNTILLFDSTTQITATSGQAWASSFFVKLQSGSTTNISSVANEIRGYSSGGVIQEQNSDAITLTTSLTRDTHVFTLANAGSVRVINNVRFNFASGVAIDITLRIGLPQLEQGAFATSVIPTTTTALTRSADVASVNTLSPWFNQTEFTLYAEHAPAWTGSATGFAQSPYIAGFNNSGTVGFDGYGVRESAVTTSRPQGVARSGATSIGVSAPTGSYAQAGVIVKSSFAMDSANIRICANGGSVISAANTVYGITQNTLQIGFGDQGGTAPYYLNGWLRRLTFYPRSFSNAEIQSITA